MRESAAGHERIEWRDGTAESLPLTGALVGAVVCAQAFHWFDPRAALREFARVLKRGGRLALIWNNRDLNDPLTHGYSDIVRAHAIEKGVDKEMQTDALHATNEPLVNARHEVYIGTPQLLDADGLVGRAASASYCLTEGTAFDATRDALIQLHRTYADDSGQVPLRYQTDVYTATRA